MRFRASEQEKLQIEANAQHAGLTVGSFMRSRCVAKPATRAVRRPPVETQQLAQLLGTMGDVAGGIQALVERHGCKEAITEVEVRDALGTFREAAAAILRALGKRPALHSGRGP